MTESSDSRTVARAASVNLLGMVARSSRILVTVFVTKVSGPAVFGLFTLALAVIDIVGRLALFGMDKSVLKFVPEKKDESRDHQHRTLSAAFAIAVALGVLLTVLLVVLAPWIAGRWLDEPGVALPLRVVAASLLPMTLLTLFLAATKALKIMSYDAFVTGMFLPASLLAMAVPILWADDDLLVLAWAYTGSTVAGLGVSAWFFRRHFSLGRAFSAPDRGSLGAMLRFSTPLGLHDFVQFLSTKLEIFILAVFVTPAELGVYALAAEMANVIRKFRQVFDPILIPLMSEAHDLADWVRLRAHVSRVVRWVLTLGALYVGMMALFPREILGLFGDEFVAGVTVLLLLCGSQLLNTGTGLLDMAMLASGRPRINLQNVTLILVTQTTLNLLLIPRYGLVGAGMAAVAAYALVSVVRLLQTVRMLGLQPFDASHLKPLLAAAGAAGAVTLVHRLPGVGTSSLAWIPLLAAYVAVYAGLLRGMGFEDEDRALLQAVLRRRKQNAG